MAIDLANIRFHYPDRPNHPVLNIPSWSLATGECAFIHGPSGGGKSTLLSLLSGLLMAEQGQINILGQRLDQMSSRQRDRFRANHIGYVFQQFNLIPYLDAIDNIRLASQFSQRKKGAAIDHDIKTLLATLNIAESDWHIPARNLSIGQQQRVAIARALINKPQLLIADEPTSSLDQANRDAFMTLLMSLVEEHQITLLFVSHDMSLCRYFKRVDALTEINRIEEAL
ncbi:putative ABC transport system ATP-binding protein [Sinobacterium caligoides]|uniref:Putative ABC transport system ATP-binding protein n=1 Tax=Sinobacterium caligoides TaxID=933926 RepID=A0A3N2DH31_9GAMM|nr:ATP-binding cassette domain-containing protein [Sinobacterium caligoides]ROR98684.1 putative ABC transport system ATP-binding protein [Sinobacterium caligoides]